MLVVLVNSFIVCLNHLLKVVNLFVQLSYLFVLYPSQYPTIHCINLLLLLCLMSVLLEFQLQPFLLTYQIFAILMLRLDLFLQSLKLSPLLLSLLFILIKSVHLLLLLCFFTHQINEMLVFPPLQHFLFHHIRQVTELLQFFIPFYLPIL